MRANTYFFVAALLSYCVVPAAGQEIAVSRLADVDWPANYDGAAAPLPDNRLAGVNRILLPVLLPPKFLDYRTFQLVNDPLNYTASVRQRSMSIAITGTRIAFDPPGAAATAAPTTAAFGENSVTVTKTQFGAAYALTIECQRASDRRCNEASFATNMLNAAVFVGGGKGDAGPAFREMGAAAPLPPGTPDPNFQFNSPGQLLPGSGTGVSGQVVYAPGIRFPIESQPAYLNSQVWNIGGSHGPKGSWKDPRNYRYPWRDNFCETRSRPTPACPSGTGHQGVDIRPADPRDAVHWAVAVEDGRIGNIGTYSVSLTGRSGTEYRYLHTEMSKLAVKQGDQVARGQRIGLVSNDFGGTATPVHLHFEVLQNVSGRGFRHVPAYMSLVRAYQRAN